MDLRMQVLNKLKVISKVIMENPNSRNNLGTRDWYVRCTTNTTAEMLTQSPSCKLEDV